MMSKLNIDVKYSALYRPESIGMLERQHRGLKDSLKSALIQMGDKHQQYWLDHLPFVLLGRRAAFQPDLGASASELTFGKKVTLPGQILADPDTTTDLQELLQQVRLNTNNKAMQPSRHSPPERQLPDIPTDVTHAYTRQHQKIGLQPNFEGPFKIDGRVSNSVMRLEVGNYSDGSKRYEYRHLNDLKLAHPESLAASAERPKLGRPSASKDTDNKTPMSDPKPPVNNNPQLVVETKQTPTERENSNSSSNHSGPPSIKPFKDRPTRSTRNPNPYYVDAIWSASPAELSIINGSISAKVEV